MALGGIYDTGTVTVSGTPALNVTGVGTLWSPVVEIGDWIWIAGQVGMIGAVVDDTHLTLEAPWQGTPPAAAAYVITKMSWLRYDPALTQSKLRELLESLEAQGTFLFVEGAAPDPDMGEDGQWALKTDVAPWKLWFKVGGVWVPQATPAGLKWRGTWSSATSYSIADAVERNGSSYVAKTANLNKPPESNAADWDLMAAKGNTGAQGATGPQGVVWKGNWSSATAYVVNDAVAQGGNSYIAVAPNTNQMPPGAAWNLLAQGGTTTIADRQIEPIKLNSDLVSEKLGFANELQVVHYGSAQTLTAAQQAQARATVFAAPFDAMAFHGVQVNGNMDVAQQYLGAELVMSPGVVEFPVDQWCCHWTHSGSAFRCQQQPAYGAINKGHAWCLRFAATTGGNVGAIASDYARIFQAIEGWRVNRLMLGASTVGFTICFWASFPISGLACLAVHSGSGDRTYLLEFSVTGGVFAFYKLFVPGDGLGIWPMDNTAGMIINICSKAGSNYQGAAGWQAGVKFSTSGTQNFFASNGATIYLTGVSILPGDVRDAIQQGQSHMLMRSYVDEIVDCQRYYRRLVAGNGNYALMGQCQSVNAGFFPYSFDIPMRAAPSRDITADAHFSASSNSGAAVALTALTLYNAGERNGLFTFSTAGGLAAGDATLLQGNNAAARLGLQARM
jgi:hypothetical protein